MTFVVALLWLIGKSAVAADTTAIANTHTKTISILIRLIATLFLTLNPHLQTHLRIITDNIFIGPGHQVAQTAIPCPAISSHVVEVKCIILFRIALILLVDVN